jgi:hypothetical protein
LISAALQWLRTGPPSPPSAGKQKYLEKVLRHVIAATAAEGGKTQHFYDRQQWML